MKGNCKHCGKEHTWSRNSKGVYCSNKCQGEARRQEATQQWLAGGCKSLHGVRFIKSHLQSINNSCWECGLSEWRGKPITLELEHIDGNGYNHNINNLKLLCPNCHSQTATYKNKNKGKGRQARLAQR